MSDEKRLDRIENNTVAIAKDVSAINSTLAAQHVSLTEHMRRTGLLEAELKPLKTRMDMIMGAIKLITVAGGIVALIEAIRLFK